MREYHMKNYIKNFWTISLLILSMNVTIYAQDENAGQPGAFLRMGIGSRAVGMGRAFTAVADDASAGFWNPAGLGVLDKIEFTGTYAMLSMDRRHNFAAIAVPLGSFGTIGMSWIGLGVSGIDGRDLLGESTGSFDNREDAYFLSWGIPLNSRLRVGANAKFIRHSLESYHSSGFGFDLGVHYTVTDMIKVGAVVQDLATNVNWNTSGSRSESFPLAARLGVGIQPFSFPVTFGIDYSYTENRGSGFHMGAECILLHGFGLRTGYDNGHLTAGGFFTFPFNENNIQTDYSFLRDPIDGSYVHRISLSLKFDKSILGEKNVSTEIVDEKNGVLHLFSPTPDARIVRTVDKYPNYGLINAGAAMGCHEGDKYDIIRLEKSEDWKGEFRSVIGTVIVIKAHVDLSAVRVIWIKEGCRLTNGDILMKVEEN